jgi:type IV secretory pathway VirB6-like protein
MAATSMAQAPPKIGSVDQAELDAYVTAVKNAKTKEEIEALPPSPVVDATNCQSLRSNSRSMSGIVSDMVRSGGTICPCAPAPSLWLERLVSCFTEKPGGIIYEAVNGLILDGLYREFYQSMVTASIFLAVVLFGINLITGSIQSLPKESFTLILKIAFVVFFFQEFSRFYGAGLDLIAYLTEIINKSVGQIGDVCNGSGEATIWARWDCLFQKFTGLVGGYLGAGILGYMTYWLFSGGFGVGVFFGVGYIILTIMVLAMRLVYSYIVAIIAVSFLILLAPLFVPLIFFGTNYQRFATWFKLILAYAIQPMLLFLFMIIMLTALEYTIFVGEYSLYGAFAGGQGHLVDVAMAFIDLVAQAPSGVISGSLTTAPDPQQAGQAATGGNGGSLSALQQGISNAISAVSGNVTDWSKYIYDKLVGSHTAHTDYGAISENPNVTDGANQKTKAGIAGTVMTGDQASGAAGAEGSMEVGAIFPSLDLDGTAASLNTTKEEWFEKLSLSIIASSIISFVLYNLGNTIPEITHDLIAQRFGAGFGSVTKMRMLGEAEMRKSMEGSKEAVRRGEKSGDPEQDTKNVVGEMLDGYAKTTVTSMAASMRQKGIE